MGIKETKTFIKSQPLINLYNRNLKLCSQSSFEKNQPEEEVGVDAPLHR